jgi:cytochrome c oxidase subunit 2
MLIVIRLSITGIWRRIAGLLLVAGCLVVSSAQGADERAPGTVAEHRILKTIAQPAPGIRYCVTCHGVDGRGNEAVRAPKLAGMARWYLARQLAGFQLGYRGSHSDDLDGKEMRPMAELLTPAMTNQALNWIATWPVDKPVATIAGDARRGRQLYQRCMSCHGNNAQGIEGMGGPALAGQSDWYLAVQLRKFKSGLRGTQADDTYGRQMQAMTVLLKDDADIADVVSYIQTLSL